MKTVLRIAFTFMFSMVMISVANAQSAPVKEMSREQFNNLTMEQVNYLKTNGIEVRIIEANGTVSQTLDGAQLPAMNLDAATEADKAQIMQSQEAARQSAIQARQARAEELGIQLDANGNVVPAASQQQVPDYMIEAPQAPQSQSAENNEK